MVTIGTTQIICLTSFPCFLFSEVLPDVLKTACGKCNDKQKERLRKVLLRLKNDPKLTEDYNKIIEKYDPDRQYVDNLEKFLLSWSVT